MECVRCEKELTDEIEDEIEYDYFGNPWCVKCMLEDLQASYFEQEEIIG